MRLPRITYGALLAGVLQIAWIDIRGIGFRRRDAAQLSVEDLIRIDACGTVAMGLATIDPIRALPSSARQLLLALKAGEPSRISRALSMQAGFEAYMGSARRSKVAFLLREARKLAESTRNPLDRALQSGWLGDPSSG